MGMSRFEQLRRMLPPSTVVLGVDEHTACTLDLDAGRAEVRGRGGVTILRGGQTIRHEDGGGFSLKELAPPAGVGAKHPGAETQAERITGRGASPLRTPTEAALAQAAALIANGDLAAGLRLASQGADAGLAAVLHQAAQALEAQSGDDAIPERLIELLLQARAGLRDAQRWDLADRLRDGLAELGIEVQDTPEGSSWARR
jgi:hypothetical protein